MLRVVDGAVGGDVQADGDGVPVAALHAAAALSLPEPGIGQFVLPALVPNRRFRVLHQQVPLPQRAFGHLLRVLGHLRANHSRFGIPPNLIVLLPALATEDEREEKPITFGTGGIVLSLQSEEAAVRRFQGGVDRAPLGDELVQFEGENRIALRRADAATQEEHLLQVGPAAGGIQAGGLGQHRRPLGQGDRRAPPQVGRTAVRPYILHAEGLLDPDGDGVADELLVGEIDRRAGFHRAP